MSERLLFELKAVDNATAPLRQVQNELQRTAGVAGSATKDFRKFALGGLQQAGFQIGDFAVQLANGTNKMQAFGQQAPQLLQIFGPIGSLAGAAIAVFAAFAVIMEKTKKGANDFSDAVKNLTEEIKKNQDAVLMAKFGTDIFGVASASQQIEDFQTRITSLQASINLMKIQGGKAAAFSGLVAGGVKELEAEKKVLQDLLDTLNAQKEAQRMLNGGLSVAAGLQRAAVLSKQEELRLIKQQAVDQQNAADKANYLKQVFHMLAGETSSISLGMKELPPILDKAAIAAYKLAAAMQGTRTAANAVLSSMMQMDAARLKKQGQVQAVAAGFVGMPELDTVASRKALNAAKAAILEKNNALKTGGSKDDPMKTLRDQLELEVRLLGKSEAQQRVIQALGGDWKKYSSEAITGLVDQIESMEELNRVAETQKEIAGTIKSSMSDAFMSIVDGTKSVADAFKDMTRQIIAKLYEQLVVQQMVNAAMGLLGSVFPSIAPMLSGAKAMGGPVTGGKPYMVGERGPEIVVPSRNGNVIPNNQLGGGGVTVNQTINITTGVQQTVRAEIRSLMPQIADSAKRAVLDAKQRGGTYGSAFA